MYETEPFPVKEVSAIPPKAPTGRYRGSYSGLSYRIRSLQTGSGFEFPTPDKLGERSLRSMVANIGRGNGCEYSVRLSNNRETIGVYRLK